MNCLSWWLPVLLLPLPVCPPELFVLFLIAYVYRSRPCVYCCLVLFGLSVSTFYWTQLTLYTSQMVTSMGDSSSRVWSIALPALGGSTGKRVGFEIDLGWPSR